MEAFSFPLEFRAKILGGPVVPEITRPRFPRVDLTLDTPVVLPSKSMFRIGNAGTEESLADALVEKTANVLGGLARIVRTRIPIWTLEKYRRLGDKSTAPRDISCTPKRRH